MAVERSEKRKLRQGRVRKKVRGTDERPRLSVYRSLQHIYVQVISDESGQRWPRPRPRSRNCARRREHSAVSPRPRPSARRSPIAVASMG